MNQAILRELLYNRLHAVLSLNTGAFLAFAKCTCTLRLFGVVFLVCWQDVAKPFYSSRSVAGPLVRQCSGICNNRLSSHERTLFVRVWSEAVSVDCVASSFQEEMTGSC